MALALFNNMRLPDVVDQPLLKDACGQWFKDIVRAVFGSRDPATNVRHVREIFALVGKGNSKTTYSAALMLTAVLMNVRKNVEFLFVAPTHAISDLAYDAAKAMVEIDPALTQRFHIREHRKEIYDRVNRVRLKVKTFDLSILTGPKPAGVLIDEIHLLGKSQHTAKVLRQIRGGMEKNTDGFVVFITTQSDSVPAGAFKSELYLARQIRDGKFKGRMLPILYEFPKDIAKDQAQWENPKNWHMVMPNLGRSLNLASMIEDYKAEKLKGMEAIRMWASQHVSVEIGIGLTTDRWAGADFWQQGEDDTITLERIAAECEAVVVGIDGGGLDDLFGLTVLGRHKVTKEWMAWSTAWFHEGVLDRRASIASVLETFRDLGEITMVDDRLEDLSQIVEVVSFFKDADVLVKVAVDPAGIGELIDVLEAVGVTIESKMVVGAPQGYAMMNALKTAERKLANGTLKHSKSSAMDWNISNLKIEPTATAIRATKQNAGDAKIDMAVSLFNAVTEMTKNPGVTVTRSYIEDNPVLIV